MLAVCKSIAVLLMVWRLPPIRRQPKIQKPTPAIDSPDRPTSGSGLNTTYCEESSRVSCSDNTLLIYVCLSKYPEALLLIRTTNLNVSNEYLNSPSVFYFKQLTWMLCPSNIRLVFFLSLMYVDLVEPERGHKQTMESKWVIADCTIQMGS